MEPPSPAEPAVVTESNLSTDSSPARLPPPGFRRTKLLLSLLVLAALALRIWGITWSLPNQERLFSYHPDEGVNLVKGVLDKDGAPRPHLDLRFYNYGSLYFYLWQSASSVNRAYGAISLAATGTPDKPDRESFASLILVGRLVTAVLGALTLIPIFTLGSRLFGRSTGWLGAVTYGVIPVAVVHAHFATVDMTATFFVAVSLALGARLLDNPDWGNIVLAGLACGLAAAAKYNCQLVLFAPMAALVLTGKTTISMRAAKTAVLLVSAGIGFVASCPGILVNWDGFRHDFLYELHKSGEGMGLLFTNTGNGWLYHLTSSLRFGLGVPLLLLVLAGVIFAAARRTKQDWYLFAFLIPYYFVIGYAQVRFMRYVIPILPALSIMAGRMVAEAWESRQVLGRAVASISAVAFAVSLLLTLSLDRLMASPDSRDAANAYLDSTAQQGALVAFARLPWYDVPPLAPEFTAPSPAMRREAAQKLTRFICRMPGNNAELDANVLSAPSPDFVVVSDIATEDWDRLKDVRWMEFKRILDSGYTRNDFQKSPSIFGINFGKPAYVPNDILYIYPRVTVYTKK